MKEAREIRRKKRKEHAGKIKTSAKLGIHRVSSKQNQKEEKSKAKCRSQNI